MAKLIRIQSTIDINVTPGLQAKDVTNKDTAVGDRLKVAATWPKCTVFVKKGVGLYPAEIKEWATVKALVKDKVFTVTDDDSEDATASAVAEKLETNMKQAGIETAKAKRTKISLDSVAGN